MDLSCSQANFLLEDSIGNGELAICVKIEQEAPIVITVTNAVPSKESFLGHWVPLNSSVEINKVQDLII